MISDRNRFIRGTSVSESEDTYMFGYDEMFDFNRDGKLDAWERAAEYQFMEEMLEHDCDDTDDFDSDDE